MSHNMARMSLGLALALSTLSVTAATAPTSGVTRIATMTIPAAPLASRAQLDVYIRTTPPADSPLNWLTPGAQRRFLDSMLFDEHGLGGMDLGDVRYELTRQQAYTLLQLFGATAYALDLDARTRAPEAAGASATMESAYDRLIAAERASAGNAVQAVTQSYQADFAALQNPHERSTLGDGDLTLLFRATCLATRLAASSAYLPDLRADFAELQKRQLVDRPHARDFHDALVAAGRADEAKALLAAWPAIEHRPPPSMRTAYRIREGLPSLWIATPDVRKRELVRLRFNTRLRAQVIVLAATGSSFSAMAAHDIEADPQLADIFREYGQWVAPPDEVTAFDAVRDWNQLYPSVRLGIAHDLDTLPMIKQIEMPTFYFLDHGAVVDTVAGWPKGGNLDAIRRGLRRIDLLR